MIKYKSGYRHQLHETVWTNTEIYPDVDIRSDYIMLLTSGQLGVRKGYAWDGPSGPCRLLADRLPAFMRNMYLRKILPGSLFHDALSELLRLELLDRKWYPQIHKEFRRVNLECGMCKARAWWTYRAVVRFGKSATMAKSKRKVFTAP